MHDVKPDGELTEEQEKLASQLSTEQIEEIDNNILACVSTRSRKVARVVGMAMEKSENVENVLPDIFYSQRVKLLVEKGLIKAEGDLNYMRYSEVRLP